MRIAPFAALRPPSDRAADVVSVPYDVVSTDEARALAEGKPDSFLHVIRPEIDLPDSTDPYADEVYAGGKAALAGLVERGALQDDGERALYLYQQRWGEHVQTGVVCCAHIEDYVEGRIKRHEFTRKAKEDDRTRHVQTLEANTGPVFLAYRDDDVLQRLIDDAQQGAPLYDVQGPHDTQHKVWRVTDAQPFVEAFGKLPHSYVADGHHRAASAARAGAERKAANSAHTGEEEYNWFLVVLFPASTLKILPYHRVLMGTGVSHDKLMAALHDVGEVSETSAPGPTEPGRFDVFTGDTWHRVVVKPELIPSDAVGSLDVAVLQEQVLKPVFDIQDVRSDERIDFVGGIHGTAGLEKRVKAGKAEVAVAMAATTMDQLMAVADAGDVMPPKSTWFEPKLLSGLFVHRIA
jgi:uncharacterized protein (DUF1015 family)